MRLEPTPWRLELALKIPPARSWTAWVPLDPFMRHAPIRPAHRDRTTPRPVTLLRGASGRPALAFQQPVYRNRWRMIAEGRPPPPFLALQQMQLGRLERRRMKCFGRAGARLEQRLGLPALGVVSWVSGASCVGCAVCAFHTTNIAHRSRCCSQLAVLLPRARRKPGPSFLPCAVFESSGHARDRDRTVSATKPA